ncbi:MAG: helix-turn-helix domain-containing protein, partial [Solirubrobacteraceae bacterium]
SAFDAVAGEPHDRSLAPYPEVAQRMRCEHRPVRRAIRSGELEAAFIGGRWLVREETVDDWSVAEAPPSPSAFSCFFVVGTGD